jgi:hypothetical protein
MVHVTCDLCGKELRPGETEHYVVKIEAFAAQDPAELTDADLEEDHLEAIGEILRELEETDAELELPPATRRFRYDLCPECHQRFVRDPLAKEYSQKVTFSKN